MLNIEEQEKIFDAYSARTKKHMDWFNEVVVWTVTGVVIALVVFIDLLNAGGK